jgi:hypothetical protein
MMEIEGLHTLVPQAKYELCMSNGSQDIACYM